jgi:two-component system response regulator YesN
MKVFIADDEVIVRVGMKSIIDWHSYGHEVIGEAENGEQAYNKIIKLHPDLVITDIKMPVTDGIELIKKVKEFDPGIKIIVLSGYGEYNLVRDAMKLGADDYLLKLETDPKKLIGLIQRMSSGKDNVGHTNRTKPSKEQLAILRESFFKDLISNRIKTKKEFEENLRSLHIRISKYFTYCLLIRVNEYHKYEGLDERELLTVCRSIKALIQECLDDSCPGYCIEIKTGEFALFFSVVDSEEKREPSELEIRDTVQSISEMIDRYLNFTIVCGVGRGKGSVKGIMAAFNLAVRALDSARTDPKGYCLLLEDKQDSEEDTTDSPGFSVMKYKKELFLALAKHEQERMISIFKEIQKEVLGGITDTEEYAKIAAEIVYILSEYFNKYEIQAQVVLKNSYLDFKELKYLESLQQIEGWLSNVIADLVEYLATDTSLHPKIIERAKEYIHSHYSDQLALNIIAEQIHLSPNYFCSLFKKYEGIGCVEYLNSYRIDQAKKLLKVSDKKIYEIAFHVGFQNNNYFNRLFKKKTGYTPSEYRGLKIV